VRSRACIREVPALELQELEPERALGHGTDLLAQVNVSGRPRMLIMRTEG
jgi:hypothetical protein